METFSINFYAPKIDQPSKHLAEAKVYEIIDPINLRDFLETRQRLSSIYEIVESTATWNNDTKIYTLLYTGKLANVFVRKLQKTSVFKILVEQLHTNNIEFLDIRKIGLDRYKAIIPDYARPLLDASTYNNKQGFTINSKGYRCSEFQDIDWKNSIVVFGCSMACGVGLENENTLEKHLSEIINAPVVSLGVAGSSPQYSFDNSVLLKENFPEPKCVVHLWSEFNRSVLYDKDKIIHQGPTWNEEGLKFYPEEHLALTMNIYHAASKHLWKNYFAYSFFNSTASLLKIPELPFVDFAADKSHYGPISARLSAEKIAKDLLPSLMLK